MGQREDVQASLLASHGVDEVARRKVADQVREVVEEGADSLATAAAAQDPEGGLTANSVATAASAVVLASDLRAPEDHPLMVLPARDDVDPELVAMAERFRAERHEPDVVAELSAANESAKAWENRQGWRGRLANVERLLSEFWNNGDAADDLMGEDWAKLQQALAEVRAMIDGDGE